MSVDSYMNIQLTGAEEIIDQKTPERLGQVLIRFVIWSHVVLAVWAEANNVI